MRSVLFFSALAITIAGVHAQSPSCDALPISYDPAGIVFVAADMSFGDSVIVIPVTNTSMVSMAYPQLKLVPLTPLPPGMTQNSHWDTFASSWNTGQTMPANCFFDVLLPIPLDYTVTFEVWAYNLTPLLVDDSCVFDLPFTINLNPSGTGIGQLLGERQPGIWPVPASDLVYVRLPENTGPCRLVLSSNLGSVVRSLDVAHGVAEIPLDVSGLPVGRYVLDRIVNGRSVHHYGFSVVR